MKQRILIPFLYVSASSSVILMIPNICVSGDEEWDVYARLEKSPKLSSSFELLWMASIFSFSCIPDMSDIYSFSFAIPTISCHGSGATIDEWPVSKNGEMK